MNAIDLSRLTDRERKTYAEGLAIVKRRLEAGRQAKAQRAADEAKRNRELVTKRMGADLARKCFGVSTPPTPTAKPSPSRKNFSAASDEPAWPRATRFLSISAGTAKPRVTRKIYTAPLFGR